MPTSPTRRDEAPFGGEIAEALERARPDLQRVLVRFRVPAAEAEDLVQEVLLSFIRKRDEVHDSTRWLAGALRRECLKYWRTQRRRFTEAMDRSLLDLIEEPGPGLESRVELRFELRRALAALKERCRSLLYLRYAEGCNEEETAARLGYSVSSIDKILRRCVTALAGRLVGTGALREDSTR